MPKLHLVGITPDHRGLVLSEHARAKRGDMVLEIDDRLLEAIDKAQRLRTRDEGHRLESAALPTKRVVVNGDGTATRLTPREIQQRLRAGESVTALARSSGTDEAWIQRFAAPVLAEQAKVIERARTLTFTKRGVGPSGATLGPAVAANVIDRGVPLTLPDLDAGWGAYQGLDGGWHVTFVFPLRGRRQTAEWELDLATGDLTARNKLATDLGWREPGKKLPQPKRAKVPAPKRAPAGRVETGAATPGTTPPDAAHPEVSAPDATAVETPTSETPTPETTAAGTAGPETAAPAASEPADERPDADTVQVLPLSEETTSLPPGGLVSKAPPPARKAPARKAPALKAPPRKPAPTAKRTAAAITEAPAQSVVPVPPAGSMPPTDLDVVAVLGDLPALGDDEAEPEQVIVLPAEPDEYDPPTGPISLQNRPQPAPLGAPPAPPGGPPAP